MAKLFPLFAKALYGAKSLDEATAAGAELNEGIKTRLEPLLVGAAPFFGGSQTLTMAEVWERPCVDLFVHNAWDWGLTFCLSSLRSW